jgi:hypothetical protein
MKDDADVKLTADIGTLTILNPIIVFGFKDNKPSEIDASRELHNGPAFIPSGVRMKGVATIDEDGDSDDTDFGDQRLWH